jgi:hypothetical protein
MTSLFEQAARPARTRLARRWVEPCDACGGRGWVQGGSGRGAVALDGARACACCDGEGSFHLPSRLGETVALLTRVSGLRSTPRVCLRVLRSIHREGLLSGGRERQPSLFGTP